MLRALSHRSLLLATAILLAPFALRAQNATATCKDGTTSTATGRGACSGHGGVDKSAKMAKSDTKASRKAARTEAKADAKAAKADTKADVKGDTKSAKADEKATSKAVSSDVKQTGKSANASAARTTAANTDATNATAKCKDGTYSHAATHRGACSRHGGVAEWLKS
jgi:ABC-type Na+ efflux pump permease subunit